ncbi:hypothetical protein NE237_016693 [Protea cynaroides]|uniref:DUF4283 domain-containing protein n=1 Tax=Protea cynaroides TaxID=273540 RepID=A0A9Q0HFA2_9MAGN|nr:hypothetical protein NE237_016693 [Protea cynaroides]
MTLVGKVIARKTVRRQTVLEGLTAAWHTKKGVHAVLLKPNVYTFTFGHQMGLIHVLEESVWSAASNLLILEHWNDQGVQDFKHFHIWVHFFGSPSELITEAIVPKIARKVGTPLSIMHIDGNSREGGGGSVFHIFALVYSGPFKIHYVILSYLSTSFKMINWSYCAMNVFM